MNVGKYIENDHYAAMLALWNKRGWKPCPSGFLPSNGFVIVQDGNVIAYMGVYIDKPIAFVGWTITNIELNARTNIKALKLLWNACLNKAKENKCRYVFSITDEPCWGKLLQKYGMKTEETGVTTYSMDLCS